MKKWVIGLGVVAGVGVLIYLAKRSASKISAQVAASQAATNAAVDQTGLTDQAVGPAGAGAQMYVPMAVSGQLTGQSTLWTASAEQSKLVGPRFPDYYDADSGYFVFKNPSGGPNYTITLDSSGRITGSGTTTAPMAA